MMSRTSNELIKVFVYGTLKRGQPNHHWLTQPEKGKACFIGEGMTVEKFPLVVGTRYNIPFLLDKRGSGHQVRGEIYEVDEQMFASLDVLEDYPNYYDRELQSIMTTQNTNVQCWLYLIRKYPAHLLAKRHLESYHDSAEQPYCESYLESDAGDIYEMA